MLLIGLGQSWEGRKEGREERFTNGNVNRLDNDSFGGLFGNVLDAHATLQTADDAWSTVGTVVEDSEVPRKRGRLEGGREGGGG